MQSGIKPTGSMRSKSSKGKLLSPIDIITLLFTAWIMVYMAVGHKRVEDFGYHFACYLSIFVGVILSAYLERIWEGKEGWWFRVFRFLRGLYPVLLFTYFYTSNHSFNRVLITTWQDPLFIEADRAIFGYLPSLEWGIKYNHWLISELFHFAYFCYYPMIVGLPVYLWFKDKKAFEELIFVLTFSFYTFYFIYSLLPTIGGRYFDEALTRTKLYRAGPFTRIMAFIYNNSRHWGGAFPSSHVGIAVVLTVAALAYKNTRKMGYVFAVVTLFLSLATVYCHYHWFVDALGGIVVGIGSFYLGRWVYNKMLENR